MQPTALLVIDVQQSFEHMPFWSEEGLAGYQSKQNALITYARSQFWPVIFIYHQSRGPFSLASGLLEPMTWVDRQAGDPVFYKRVHNALSESGLEPYLYARGISRLLISGIRTEQCCETTARFASDSGYEVEYILDATHTFAMTRPNGEKASADSIKSHTAMVLGGRFTTMWNTEDFISWNPPESINCRCPRSGRSVAEDSLTHYNGATVGFCNTGCRDSFARDRQSFGADRFYFDQLIARQAIAQAYI